LPHAAIGGEYAQAHSPLTAFGSLGMTEERSAFCCAECGSKDISFPENPEPGDMVTCLGCGASNRYDEIQKIAAKLGQDAVTDIVRDALRSLKGLKLE
jgi:hypothetical protein